MSYGLIYMFTNKANNKKYIGQTIQNIKNRIAQHKYKSKENSENYAFYNAINKYGWDNFKCEIIDYADSEIDLHEKEIYYINKFDTYKNGYNMTYGGEGTIGNGKLSIEQVTNIKKILRDSNLSTKEISENIGVKQGTIESIYYGFSWSYINVEGFQPRMKRKEKLKKPKEKENSKNILSNDTVIDIKKDLMFGELSYTDIATKYKTTKHTISRIANGKSYINVIVENFNIIKRDSKGESNGMSKLTEEIVIEIKTMIQDGFTNKEISKHFNIPPNTISRIRSGKRWSNVKV